MEAGEVIGLVFFMLILGGTIIGVVAIRSKPREDTRNLTEAVERIEAKLDGRMNAIESRMANLETIVLETEKHREFDRAL